MITIKDNLQAIFWDFDGVLMDSNPVRNSGFASVLAEFPAEQVEALLVYHRANGGLSRYVKFRYFFEVIRKEHVTEAEIQQWAQRFSTIMKEQLLNSTLLIHETLDWVKAHYQHLPMHIVSGSDGTELKYLCQYHGIDQYFKDIEGSPTPKKQLVAQLLGKYNYVPDHCVLVGDSVNDFDAADVNGMAFFAYNNNAIMGLHNY